MQGLNADTHIYSYGRRNLHVVPRVATNNSKYAQKSSDKTHFTQVQTPYKHVQESNSWNEFSNADDIATIRK